MNGLSRNSLPPGSSADTNAASAAHRARAALVGALFLTSTITFAIGSAQINAYFDDASKGRGALAVGVLLEAYTALAVVGIALAVLPLLRRESRQMAQGYVALRSGAPIVPIVLGGNHELFLGRRIIVRILPPMDPRELARPGTGDVALAPGSQEERAAAHRLVEAFHAQTAAEVARAHRDAEPPPGHRKRGLRLTKMFR